MTQCKLCTRGGSGGGSQQREVADGADVVFSDTDFDCFAFWPIARLNAETAKICLSYFHM